MKRIIKNWKRIGVIKVNIRRIRKRVIRKAEIKIRRIVNIKGKR